jgi:hypothetical protein
MGRILFLSAITYLAYRYITRSNRKAQSAITARHGSTELLPPEEGGAVVESAVVTRQLPQPSGAAEPDPRV